MLGSEKRRDCIGATGVRQRATMLKVTTVLKSDVGVDVPYLIGVFDSIELARRACSGVGTYFLITAELNCVYPPGRMHDVEVIDRVSSLSITLGG